MPGWLSATLIVIASVAATEAFAWAAHRFVMHSPLGWGLHRTHHSEANRMGFGGGWEWNDLYAVIFAAPAVVLFWVGRDPALKWAFWAGLGVTIYGVALRAGARRAGARAGAGPVHAEGRLRQAARAGSPAAPRDARADGLGELRLPLRPGRQAAEGAAEGERLGGGGVSAAMSPGRQTAVGLSLAAAIFAAWLTLHVWGVFFYRPTLASLWIAPLLIAADTWLGAGMFIVAHDCMHGSLAPGRPRLNTAIGAAMLALYAGFDFRKLNMKHHLHHRHSGHEGDPDFHPGAPRSYWKWYARFFFEYYGWRQQAAILGVLLIYVFVLHASPA